MELKIGHVMIKNPFLKTLCLLSVSSLGHGYSWNPLSYWSQEAKAPAQSKQQSLSSDDFEIIGPLKETSKKNSALQEDQANNFEEIVFSEQDMEDRIAKEKAKEIKFVENMNAFYKANDEAREQEEKKLQELENLFHEKIKKIKSEKGNRWMQKDQELVSNIELCKGKVALTRTLIDNILNNWNTYQYDQANLLDKELMDVRALLKSIGVGKSLLDGIAAKLDFSAYRPLEEDMKQIKHLKKQILSLEKERNKNCWDFGTVVVKNMYNKFLFASV